MSLTTLQNFYKVSLTRRMATTGALNMYVSALPATATSGWLVISPSNTSLREIIKFSSTGTDSNGTYVVISSADDRGLGGTTAQTHEIGEPVRMNYTSLHQTEISDAIDQIVAGGAQDATTSVKGIAKLPRIAISTSVTYSPVTLAGEMLILIAKGNVVVPAGTPGTITVNMKINTVTVDTQVATQNLSGGFGGVSPVSFLYFATPGAQTNAITFDQTVSNLQIISIII